MIGSAVIANIETFVTMKTQPQNNSHYSVVVNVNNKLYKTYSFSKKSSAYFFLLNAIKPLAQTLVEEDSALISASCYMHTSGKRRLLSKKNLTEVHF